jgi:isochorismate pyruvate lyase
LALKRVGEPRTRPRALPYGFRTLSQVRGAIDRIDRRVVGLLAARGEAVRAAAYFKATPAAVRAPRRAVRVIANARRLARRRAMDPDLVARIYRAMIAAFIDDEMAVHARLRGARRQGRTG